jgi:hypothetical protein
MSRNSVTVLFLVAGAGLAAWWLFAQQKPEEPAPVAAPRAAPAAEEIDLAPARSPAKQAPVRSLEASAQVPGEIAALDVATVITCHREIRQMRGMAELDCESHDEATTYERQVCRKYREYLDRQLPQVAAAAAGCPEALAEPSVYYRALRDLANRGDVVAQRCVIQGYFGIDHDAGVHLTKADYDEYPALAKAYIAAAFERGDWSVVRWLSKTRVEMTDMMLSSAHPIGFDDRVNAYKIRRLLMLGGQPGLSSLEQDDPKRLVEYWRREKWLSPEEMEEAETWAQDMYRQHFIGSQEGASMEHEEFCPGE